MPLSAAFISDTVYTHGPVVMVMDMMADGVEVLYIPVAF